MITLFVVAVVLWTSPWSATGEASLPEVFKTPDEYQQQACESAKAELAAVREELRDSVLGADRDQIAAAEESRDEMCSDIAGGFLYRNRSFIAAALVVELAVEFLVVIYVLITVSRVERTGRDHHEKIWWLLSSRKHSFKDE